MLNVGRGIAVDSDALAAAIQNGTLYGAALDVTDPEPLPPEHPLGAWTVLITPHFQPAAFVGIFACAGPPLDNQMSRTTHYVSADTPGQRLVCEP